MEDCIIVSDTEACLKNSYKKMVLRRSTCVTTVSQCYGFIF